MTPQELLQLQKRQREAQLGGVDTEESERKRTEWYLDELNNKAVLSGEFAKADALKRGMAGSVIR